MSFTIPQRKDLLWLAERGRTVELAWAAGFFDGEGSIFVNHKRTPGGTTGRIYTIHSPCLSISQVDVRPLERWANAVGGRRPTGPYKPRSAKSNPYYRWDAMGRPSVHAIIVQIWDFISEPKREQIQRIWDELASLRTIKSPPLPALPGAAA
jgi:hypothetical protein